MKILLLSDGPHELGSLREASSGTREPFALQALVERMIASAGEFTPRKFSDTSVRGTHGKGHGLTKRAVAWLRYAQQNEFDAVVAVVDEDGERERLRAIDQAQEDRLFDLPRAFGIAIRSFDAWMLADVRALCHVMGTNVDEQSDPEAMRDPKGVFAALLECHSVEMSQREAYAAISGQAEIERIQSRCPKGFEPFARRLEELCRLFTR